MRTEEQRRIAFRLAVAPPDETLLAQHGPARMARDIASMQDVCPHLCPRREIQLVKFREPRSFTCSEILRLAPATDPARTMIGVYPLRGKGGKTVLSIWGLLGSQASWMDYVYGMSRSGVTPPNCLTVNCVEPGSITISRMGIVLLRLQSGQLVSKFSASTCADPVDSFLKRAKVLLLADFLRAVGDEASPSGEALDLPLLSYEGLLNRILVGIREKGHGGMLIVVPEAFSRRKVPLPRNLSVKYTCSMDDLWPVLVKALVVEFKHNRLEKALHRKRAAISINDFDELARLRGLRAELERQMEGVAGIISTASGVDGAVVMSDKFRLLGFGAEVRADTEAPSQVDIAKDERGRRRRTVLAQDYGTRHRSAFRYCWSNEDSVVFVFSQDGGVKAVKRVAKRVVMWDGITAVRCGL
jgi:hypothetical protein